MDELEFSRLIERYQAGDLPDHERKLVDAWLQSLKLEDQVAEWSDDEELRQARRLLSHIRSEGIGEDSRRLLDVLGGSSARVARANMRRLYLKIAASVLFLISFGYALYMLNRVQDDSRFAAESLITESTASGEKLKVGLPDG